MASVWNEIKHPEGSTEPKAQVMYAGHLGGVVAELPQPAGAPAGALPSLKCQVVCGQLVLLESQINPFGDEPVDAVWERGRMRTEFIIASMVLAAAAWMDNEVLKNYTDAAEALLRHKGVLSGEPGVKLAEKVIENAVEYRQEQKPKLEVLGTAAAEELAMGSLGPEEPPKQ